MAFAVKWSGLFLGFALLFAAFLWFRVRRLSPFRSRLALLFFLFALVPAALLTLVFGRLLLQSSETFILPGVDRSLNLSLQVIKSQLFERGQLFLNNLPAEENLTPQRLKEFGFDYGGEIRAGKVRLIRTSQAPEVDSLLFADLSDAELDQLVLEGQSRIVGGEEFFEVFARRDSAVLFAAFRIPNAVVEAKEAAGRSLQNYSALLLLRERISEQKTLLWVMLLLLALVAMLSLAAAARTSAQISTPLLKLTEGMKRIGAGDLDHRVEADARDEIAYLIESFNRMADELRRSRLHLQRAERAAAWRDVARQIAHEIKNPLTPIEFALYRIENTFPKAKQKGDLQEALSCLRSEINTVRRLADSFSQAARLPHAELQPTDPVEVVAGAVDLWRHNKAEVTVELHAVPVPQVSLDAQQMRGVFTNLIKNAVEASRHGSSVEVFAEPDEQPNRVRIRVVDHGCGMDEHMQRRLFQPYFTTKSGGSGIGLFLASRIVADHGGEISVSSRLGEGTTVTVVLPTVAPSDRH